MFIIAWAHFSKQITTAPCTTASHTTLHTPPPRPRPRRKKYFHRKNQQSLTSTEQYINGDILRREVIHCINHIFNCMVGLHDLSEIMIERIFISTYIKIICYLRSAAHAVPCGTKLITVVHCRPRRLRVWKCACKLSRSLSSTWAEELWFEMVTSDKMPSRILCWYQIT